MYRLAIISIFLMVMNQCSASIIQEAVFAATKFYNHHYTTYVFWTSNNADMVNEFLKQYSGSVVSVNLVENNAIESVATTKGCPQVVMFANSLHDYNTFLKICFKLQIAFRVMLILMDTVIEESGLSIFFEAAWKHDLVDIVIFSQKYNNDTKLTTYFPYSEGICENFKPVNLKIDQNLFPRKFNNFHRCPIRTTMLKLFNIFDFNVVNNTFMSASGMDGFVFMIVIKKLNATVKIIHAVDGGDFGTHKNGRTTGFFRDIVEEDVDLLIPAGILTQSRYLVSQISYSFRILDMRWIGPKRHLISPWLKMVLPFFNYITLFLGFMTLVFVIAVIIVIRLIMKRSKLGHSVLFQSYAVLLGQTVNFVTKSHILNSLFILWVWFCFIIRIYYQGIIIGGMESNIFEKPFTTLEDAVDRGVSFGGSESLIDSFRGTKYESMFKILPFAALGDYIERIVKGEKRLLLCDVLLYKLFKPSSVQLFQANIEIVQMCFYMRPRWLAKTEIDLILFHLVEGGFISHYLGKTDMGFKKEDSKVDLVALDTSMLSPFIQSLAAMWLVCLVVFIFEIMYHKFVTR